MKTNVRPCVTPILQLTSQKDLNNCQSRLLKLQNFNKV